MMLTLITVGTHFAKSHFMDKSYGFIAHMNVNNPETTQRTPLPQAYSRNSHAHIRYMHYKYRCLLF